MAFNDIGIVGYTPPGFAYNAGRYLLGQTGIFGGGGGSPNIDINGELARINALYEQARTQGNEAITQDYQAQRGELAQSQAARGILRSGVSQLGLARLGAGRQQALAQFNSQISASQAGQQSNLLNALLGRKTAIDIADADRRRSGQNQLIGVGAGLLGSYLAGPFGGAAVSNAATGFGSKSPMNGYNYADSNMVNPSSFYQYSYPNTMVGKSPSIFGSLPE